MSKEIEIIYSEDFRENKIAGNVYGILRDAGLRPLFVQTTYNVREGRGETKYLFNNDSVLPKKQELEKMLEGINIIRLEIEE